ncbi:MAG: hypothetical protein ACMUIG_02605 [Thermoplasmatota archaeon]
MRFEDKGRRRGIIATIGSLIPLAIIGAVMIITVPEIIESYKVMKGYEELDREYMKELTERYTYSNYLGENDAHSYGFESVEGAFISGISMHLSWSDENPINRMENRPDHFSATIWSSGNLTSTGSGVSGSDGSGSLDLSLAIPDDVLRDFHGYIDIDILIFMDLAEDNYGGFLGLVSIPDNGNSYQMEIALTYLVYDS